MVTPITTSPATAATASSTVLDEETPIITTPISGESDLTRDERRLAEKQRMIADVIAEHKLDKPLIDGKDMDYLKRASGLDSLDKKRSVRGIKKRWEKDAEATAQVAIQEAALMGAANGDGKLSKDDMTYLLSKYGDKMVTSSEKIAGARNIFSMAAGGGIGFLTGFFSAVDSKKNVNGGLAMGAAAGAAIGLIGGPIGAAIGAGVGAVCGGLAQGFVKPVKAGLAGATAGVAAGRLLPKAADFLKAKLGIGFGLGVDDHTSELKAALEKAALMGYERAEEQGLVITRRGRKPILRSTASEAKFEPEKASASAAPDSVEHTQRVTKAQETVLTALRDGGDRDPELTKLLLGSADGKTKAFNEMTDAERRQIIADRYRDGDIARADILSDIAAGRYDAAGTKAKAYGVKPVAEPSKTAAPVAEEKAKAAADSVIQKLAGTSATFDGILNSGFKSMDPKAQDIFIKGLEVSGEKNAANLADMLRDVKDGKEDRALATNTMLKANGDAYDLMAAAALREAGVKQAKTSSGPATSATAANPEEREMTKS